jgi:hypothetical protein
MLTKRELVRKGKKCEGSTVRQSVEAAGRREEGRKQWRGPAMALIRPKSALRGHGKHVGRPEMAQKGKNSRACVTFKLRKFM